MPIALGPGVNGQLRPHVLLFQRLDRVPIEIEFLGQILDRGRSAAPTYVKGKPLGVERIVGQEVQPLALHLAATSALNAPNLEFEIDARIATGQVANPTPAPVVPAHVRSGAATARRFFQRRSTVMARTFESPKTPRTEGCERNPGNAYASHSRRFRFVEVAMQTCSQFPACPGMPESQHPHDFLKTQYFIRRLARSPRISTGC